MGVPEWRDVGPHEAAVKDMHALELIAEERIQAAVRNGEFDNLPGAGKPLDLTEDPLIPEDLRLAYRILRNSGYVPPEIEARKEAANLRLLIRAATDDGERRRAVTRLALLETRLEARGQSLPRAGGYYDLIVRRFERG